jgi:hypothetical protein
VWYVSDSTSHAIRRIAGGFVTTLAGNGTQGTADGVGSNARFSNGLTGIASTANSGGVAYVADYGGSTIRSISADGTVTTFAGSSSSGVADGVGTSAQFNSLRAVAVAANGTVFAVEFSRIRSISPGGVTSVLAGGGADGVTGGSADGQGTAAQFTGLGGIAVSDLTGLIVVSDRSNHKLRAVTAGGAVTTIAGGSSSGSALGSSDGSKHMYKCVDGNWRLHQVTQLL